MWRPKNETQADLQREKLAAERIGDEWGVEIEKLSERLYGIDWAIRRGKEVVAFGEFKYRHNGPFKDIFLSLAKWRKLRSLANDMSCPAMVFFQFKREAENIYWIDLRSTRKLEIEWNGSDRGQNGDKEPVVLIPFNMMKLIPFVP